jgi:hypothetical protein
MILDESFIEKGGIYIRALFVTTVLLSAFLLFISEPLVTHMIMPLLGGSPSIWNTAVVFFQGVLLLGYLYAHKMLQCLGYRKQAYLHILLVFIPFLFLPFTIPDWWSVPSSNEHISSILILLLSVIGVPFFVLSITNPMAQKWFSKTKSLSSNEPYSLYAASNIGSILALLSYPFIVEPFISLKAQLVIWLFGYILFTIFMIFCAVYTLVQSKDDIEGQKRTHQKTKVWSSIPKKVTVYKILACTFVTSFLMIGVTSYLTNYTDTMIVPFFWMMPLIAYLLSFIVTFSDKQIIGAYFWKIPWNMFILIILASWAFQFKFSLMGDFFVHTVVYFYICVYCHKKVYDLKPKADYLTSFYLWISIGGLIGGVFALVFAPIIFKTVLEYPIGLGMFLFVVVMMSKSKKPSKGDILLASIMMVVIAIIQLYSSQFMYGVYIKTFAGILLVMLSSLYAYKPSRFAIIVSGIIVVSTITSLVNPKNLYLDRSFFGVSKVSLSQDESRFIYTNGNTIHGVAFTSQEKRLVPISYYTKNGPLGQFFEATNHLSNQWKVGLVGLGVGNALAYSKPSQKWKAYEIDPVVLDIASLSEYFGFVKEFQPDIILGDARVSLSKTEENFDVLILDAYSSDSIPKHLMTSQALRVFLKNLKSDGILVFHISNRVLDLEPIVGNLTTDQGMYSYVNNHIPQISNQSEETVSKWVVSSKSKEKLEILLENEKWNELFYNDSFPLWTDDNASILKVIKILSSMR